MFEVSKKKWWEFFGEDFVGFKFLKNVLDGVFMDDN